MMIRRISYTLYILLSLTLLSSCNTMDEMLDEKQDTATLTVKIAQQDPTTVTRAISDAIENVNVLVFDAQGHLIGSAYASSSPTSVSVPVRVSSGCTICAIANTGSNTYFDGISTLKELKSVVTPAITIATALSSKSNEILYGEATNVALSSGANTQAVILKRLYSKYTFTITPSSDIAITGYQLCNVPNECSIASGNTKNPTTGFAGLNYDAVATPVYAGTVVPVGTYYIYENLAGSNPTLTTAEQRTSVNAPIGSSYLLITATGTGYNAGWTSTYRVYLGGVTNAASPVLDYTNFNINRDFNYQCNIAITGSGATDVRVSYSPTTSTRTNVYFGDATVGNYLYADGTNGPTFKSGQTVGIIYSNELTLNQYNAGCRHGRVLALKDAYSPPIHWSSNSNTSPYTDHSSAGHLYATTLKTSFDDVSSGYDALSANSSYVNAPTNYAWYYCKNYNDGTTKSFTNSGWYFPSVGDWWDIMENLCTWTDPQKTTIKGMRTSPTVIPTYVVPLVYTISGLSTSYYSNFDSKLTAAGGTVLIHADYYWSTSEYDSNNAVIVGFISNGMSFCKNLKLGPSYFYVRAVLAY
ncbi:DUF4906 domain-containing protein [Prevotella sp.]|uniref:DUF4906 domain-containing protein n=1 Tax=Prevotella sp. TaxID=59823 RepID=UPI00264770F2|nr:fimbrial protein [Prevotella sp.]MDN5553944.1 DUF4906 domain-containing protein [Prevotella sp.]